MRRFATMLALAVAIVLPASAQTTTFNVTVKQIFAVSPDSLAKLQQLVTAGGTIADATVERIVRSRYFDRSSNGGTTADSLVSFTGVLLSDPLSSGLASPSNGRVGRVHVFVRDVAAASDPQGFRGYVIQVVDGAYDTDGLKQLAPGAVVKFTGTVSYFQGAVQFTPINIEVISQNYRTSYPAALGQPITMSVEDLNKPGPVDPAANNPQAQINLANFPLNAAEYVRIENLQVETNAAFGTRFNVTYANLDRTVFVYQNDVSIRYRNDRNTDQTYISNGFNVRATGTSYTPPAVGSRVTVEGFTQPYLRDFVNYFNPNVSINISPIEDDDVTVTAGAPGVASLRNTSTVVTGTSPETITVNVQPAPNATISSVTLFYRRAGTAQYQSVALTAGTPTASGTPYSGQIPTSALGTDGSFIQYYVRATDNQNRGTDSPVQSFRVLSNGIRKIEHIQRTADGGVGSSPFSGVAFTAGSQFELNAVVMSRPDSSGFVAIQDDPALGAWSGIMLEPTGGNTVLRRGDQIKITAATVAESNGQTRLTGVTWTKTGTATPYDYKVLTTTELADAATAEAYEGMMVRVNNVTVTNVNADAGTSNCGGNCGEFVVRSEGAATNATIRVDDFSTAIPKTPLLNTLIHVGTRYRYIQGLLDFSFSNFKIEPERLIDLGGSLTGTAVGGEDVAAGLALLAPSPNPARGTATIAYRTAATAEVQIEVFDTMGRRVALLAEDLVVPGSHTATLATGDLAAGLYVVRLSQGAAAVTRPLVVVK